jgi:type IV secretion system protein VirB9
VTFDFPLEVAEKSKAQATLSENQIMMHGPITNLDFAYTILPHSIHKPAWCPDRVFNDGVKTYMSFPSASRAGYAPVLFEVNRDGKGERVLVNYRVIGTYFVIDRVIWHAELVLDINEGNIVTIAHQGD